MNSGEGVVVQMSAADAELVGAWQRARQGVAEFGNEVEKAGKKGKQAAKETEGIGSTMGQAALAAAGVTSVMGGIQTMAQLIRSEWDGILQRMEAAAGKQIELAGPQRMALMSLASNSDISRSDLTATVLKNAKGPIGQAYANVASALKEAGEGFSNKAAVDTGIAASNMLPLTDAGTTAAVSSAAVERQRMTGETPEQAIAQIVRLKGKTESSIQEIGNSLLPSVSRMALNAKGSSAGSLAALPLAIEGTANSGIADASAFSEKLLALLAREGYSGTIDDQMAKFRDDKATQAKALAVAKRTPKMESAVKQLIGGGEAWQSFNAMSSDLAGSPDEVVAKHHAEQAALAREKGQAAALLNERAVNLKDRRAIAMDDQGREAKATELAMQGLWDSGISSIRYGLTRSMRPVAHATLDHAGYLESNAGLVEQRIGELSGVGGRNLSNPQVAEMVALLREAKDEIIKLVDEARAARDDRQRPIDVRVRDLPPDTAPRGQAVGAFND